MRILVVVVAIGIGACTPTVQRAWQRTDGLRINDDASRYQAFHAARSRCMAMALGIQPTQPAVPPFVAGGNSAFVSGYNAASVQGAHRQTTRAQESIMASCMAGEGYQFSAAPTGETPR